MLLNRLAESSCPAERSEPVLDTTIASILEASAEASPDVTGLVTGVATPPARVRLTYARMCEEARRAAGALAQRFDTGECVAVYAPSIPESLLLTYAAAMAGLVLVPVVPHLRPNELRHILGSSGAAGVFLVQEHRGNRLPEVVDMVRPELPTLREVIDLGAWDAFCAGGVDLSPSRGPAPDDVGMIVFTSGTTGPPKGARLTHLGLTNAARFGALRFGMRVGDVYVNTMPLHHVGGQEVSFSICQQQATNVLVPAFQPGLVMDLIDSEHGTLTVGVPTMLVAMIDHPEFGPHRLSSLRAVSSGGAVVPADLVRHIETTLGVQVTIVFGQTETCGFISQTELDDDAEDKAASLGHPLPQLDARVVDPETGAVLPVGTVGELQVRGYNVMTGYHNLPAETEIAITADGWLRTGDLVTMDDRGYLRIAGRLKEMIVTGGVNVFPVEIEAVLATHPAVAQAAVFGVPDRHWGEEVVAAVQPAPDHPANTDQLAAWAKERLAPYKVPKRWLVVDQMPTTPMGKVQKFLLRELV